MMFTNLLVSALLLQSAGGAVAGPQSARMAPAAEWLVVVAAPVYQPDGGVTMATAPLPATGAGLVHVFARRSLCEPAVAGAGEPADAGFGWRVASQIVSRSERDVVVSVDWRRVWDGGRKVSNGPGGTVQLTLHPGARIPLDHIANLSPRTDCRAVGLGLEVRLGRAPASMPVIAASSALPIGATPGGARPVDAELWLMHTLPSGAEQVMHQTVRVPPNGGRFSFASASVATSRGDLNMQLTGAIDRYRTPAGGEFVVLTLTRVVTGQGLPASGISGTTGTPIPLSSLADVVSFEMSGSGGAGGRARGGGGGAAAGGVTVARRTDPPPPPTGGAGATGGGAAVARSGGGGRGGASAGADQLTTLLEGHKFELRMRVTERD